MATLSSVAHPRGAIPLPWQGRHGGKRYQSAGFERFCNRLRHGRVLISAIPAQPSRWLVKPTQERTTTNGTGRRESKDLSIGSGLSYPARTSSKDVVECKRATCSEGRERYACASCKSCCPISQPSLAKRGSRPG